MVISSKKKYELKERLIQVPSVNTLSSLINEYDFYVECIFKDLKELSEFKEGLELYEITHFEEVFIINDIKREEFDF